MSPLSQDDAKIIIFLYFKKPCFTLIKIHRATGPDGWQAIGFPAGPLRDLFDPSPGFLRCPFEVLRNATDCTPTSLEAQSKPCRTSPEADPNRTRTTLEAQSKPRRTSPEADPNRPRTTFEAQSNKPRSILNPRAGRVRCACFRLPY